MDQVTTDLPCTQDNATAVSDTTTTEAEFTDAAAAGSEGNRVAQESSTVCGCGRTTNTETEAHTRTHTPEARRRDGHGWRRGHVLAAAAVGFAVGQCSWYGAVQRVRESFLHGPLERSNTTLTGAHTTSASTSPLPPASTLSSSPLSPPSSTSSLFSSSSPSPPTSFTAAPPSSPPSPSSSPQSSSPSSSSHSSSSPSSPSPPLSSPPPSPPSTRTVTLTLEEFDKRVDERIRKYVEREVLDRVYPLQASMSELRRAYQSSCQPPHQQHPPSPQQQQQQHEQPQQHRRSPPLQQQQQQQPPAQQQPPPPYSPTDPHPPHTPVHDAHTHRLTNLDTRLRALEAKLDTLSHAHEHTHTQGKSVDERECVCVTEGMLNGMSGTGGTQAQKKQRDVEGRVRVLEGRWDAVNNVTMALMLRMDVHEEEVREMRSEMEAVWFDGFLDTRQALRRIEEVDRRVV